MDLTMDLHVVYDADGEYVTQFKPADPADLADRVTALRATTPGLRLWQHLGRDEWTDVTDSEMCGCHLPARPVGNHASGG